MSDCVCLSEYDGSWPTCYNSVHLVGRKEHKCYECRRVIPKGERHERVTGLWDGAWETYRFCAECSEIGLSLSCYGRSFGLLWEDVEEHVFPHMGGDCFDKLETAAAKQFLRDKYIAWRGLNEAQP